MSKTASSTRARVLIIVTFVVAFGAILAAFFWLSTPETAFAGQGAIPNFAPDTRTSWFPDRPEGDDFYPPESGPGPVMSDPAHPYVPNGEGRQPTYRVADLTNPILQPWAKEQMKAANDQVLAGKMPFIARERCWPAGVPAFQVFGRVRPVYFIQTPAIVYIIHRGDQQVRRVYMNVPHSASLRPSWYGESVGRYEGDELVVDTIGMNARTFVDNYRTPHTEQLHVVERFRLINSGNTLQVSVEVNDPGAFTTPWRAIQRFKRYDEGGFREAICAENNFDYFSYGYAAIPRDDMPDF
jgi:hypothetical protein